MTIRICGDEHMGVRLGNICRFQSGGTPSKGKPEFFNGTIPWITTTALNGGNIGKESAVDWISEQAIKESAAKIVPAFSIMVGTRVGVGKVAINTTSMSTSQDIVSLLDIDENVWSKAFLCKFLQAKGTFLNSQARGATIKGIKIDVLSELELPGIPMEEQQHISQIIDKIKAIIVIRQQQLQKLDDLVKARFVELFGGIHNSNKYPYKPIKELTDVISGGTPNRDVNEYWECGTIPWVKTTELQNNLIKEVDEYITEKGLNSSSAKLVPPGTVLIAMYGQGKTRGMTAYLNIEACTNQACACILPSDQINQTFLWKFLILSYDDLRGMAKGGNQPNLNGTIIKNYPILYPPRELQEQFAAFVAQTDKTKAVIQKALDEAQLLFDSLMQKYFG